MNNANTVALQASGLTVSFNGNTILNGLNLHVNRAEVYALIGGNGAGKSTTLNAFLGFIKPDSGSLRVCGTDVQGDLAGARQRLAYVSDGAALYDHLNAIENLRYFLTLAGVDASVQRIDAALDTVDLVREARTRRVDGYSKGMRQKVAIALALARETPAMLLDEPTSGLDPRASAEFNTLLVNLRQRDVAVLMVTHDLLGAAEVADRIGFLDGGRVAHEFFAHDFVANGAHRFDVQALHRCYSDTRSAA